MAAYNTPAHTSNRQQQGYKIEHSAAFLALYKYDSLGGDNDVGQIAQTLAGLATRTVPPPTSITIRRYTSQEHAWKINLFGQHISTGGAISPALLLFESATLCRTVPSLFSSPASERVHLHTQRTHLPRTTSEKTRRTSLTQRIFCRERASFRRWPVHANGNHGISRLYKDARVNGQAVNYTNFSTTYGEQPCNTRCAQTPSSQSATKQLGQATARHPFLTALMLARLTKGKATEAAIFGG